MSIYLRNISVGGVVASEWFEKNESAGEAYYCAFLNTIQENVPEIPPENQDVLYRHKVSMVNQNHNCAFGNYGEIALFFDMDNPIMKQLLSFDFFEYLKIRKLDYNKIKEIYPYQVIELYEKICGASWMEASSKFNDDYSYDTKSWRAIPLGVPPMLINGICINSKLMPQFESSIEEISTLFPNATIFNENKEVIAYPLNMSDQVVKK